MTGHRVDDTGVQTRQPADLAWVAFFEVVHVKFVLLGLLMHLAEERTQYRAEEHRVHKRADQHRKHSDRQKRHELARNTGPEHQRQERGQRGCNRGKHWWEHAFRSQRIGFLAVYAFRHFPICVLRDHHRAVHDHAEAQQQPKHDHEIEREANQIDDDQTEQKGQRDSRRHDDAAAQSQCRHHCSTNNNQRGHDVAFHLDHLLFGSRCLVLGVEHLHLLRIVGTLAFNNSAYLFYGLDQVGIAALGDFNRYRGNAVHTRIAFPILEGAPHRRDIRHRNDGAIHGLHRNVEQVLCILNHRWHFHAETAIAGVDRAGRNQAVVAKHGIAEFRHGDVV